MVDMHAPGITHGVFNLPCGHVHNVVFGGQAGNFGVNWAAPVFEPLDGHEVTVALLLMEDT